MYFPKMESSLNIRALHGLFSGTFEPGVTAFPESFGFRVEGDQSEEAAYITSDLLYAAKDDVVAAGYTTQVPLVFYHMLSKLELKIKRAAGVNDGIKSVTLDGVALSGTFTPVSGADLTLQEVRAGMIAAGEQTGTMTLGTTEEGSNDAIVIPQDISGKTLIFTLSDDSQLSYTFEPDTEFKSGKCHVYTITLEDKRLTFDSSILPWDSSGEEIDGSIEPYDPSKAHIGDWFYSDGSFSSDLDTEKEVIGIVFSTDLNRIGQAEKEALAEAGVPEPHGLVMSLKNVPDPTPDPDVNNEGYYWHDDEAVSWLKAPDIVGVANCDNAESCYNDISGLYNTKTVIDYMTQNGQSDKFPAFNGISVYNGLVPAPDNTTGWFIPSSGQLYDFVANFGGISEWNDDREDSGSSKDFLWYWNTSHIDDFFALLPEASYDSFNDGSSYFWTSTEGPKREDASPSVYNLNIDLEEEQVQFLDYSKGNLGDLRLILAF